jgi:hypothetical protein
VIRRVAATLTVALVATASLAAATAEPAAASNKLRFGIFDDAQTFYGPSARAFALYGALRAQLVRVTLRWGGPQGVARFRPRRPTDPSDRAYLWRRYDRVVRRAEARRIGVVFTIYGTPRWANGGRRANFPPRNPADLRDFAEAAAKRYSGRYRASDGKLLPAVRDWLAWNEPNNPIFLSPQFKRVKKKWVVQSARSYARICNAIYKGVHGTRIRGEKVACGVTAPRGNDDPTSSRPSVSPLAFLRAAKKAGLKRFDAWAHHPHLAGPAEVGVAARRRPVPGGKGITISNINRLNVQLRRLYGKTRIWLTEYGVQTRPPDIFFGVTYVRQAAALRRAFRLARSHPRIDMLLWFLLQDEVELGRWQSGLLTPDRKRKPAFRSYQQMADKSPTARVRRR